MAVDGRPEYNDLVELAEALVLGAFDAAEHPVTSELDRHFHRFGRAVADAAHDHLIYGARLIIEKAEDDALGQTDTEARAG